MLLSVEVPVTTAVTMPPPAVPVVSMTAISSCALSMFSCIFCACFIICLHVHAAAEAAEILTLCHLKCPP